MTTTSLIYSSPLGEIALLSRDDALAGAWFIGQKHFPKSLPGLNVDTYFVPPILIDSCMWLDEYFEGKNPPPGELKLDPGGSGFRQTVFAELLRIPYGKSVTYGLLASKIGCKSAQAVGEAVGHNPISIIIPCHRVVGAGGSLTGYAGGLGRKKALLDLERNLFHFNKP